MKRILSISFLLLSIALDAQSWCAPGAVWHHEYGSGGGSAFYRVAYTRDTVINNQINNVLKIRKEGIRGYGMSFYSILETDLVLSHKTNNVIYLGADTLYSLDFPAGTKWRLPKTTSFYCQTILTALDSGRINVNGQNLKFLRVSYSKFGYGGIDTIVEKIGFLNMFPFENDNWCYTDCFPFHGGPIRCYSDNGFSFNKGNLVCNYYYTTGISEAASLAVFSLYPNPANGNLFISTSQFEPQCTITISSITGAIIKEIKVENNGNLTFEINISELEKGVYFLNMNSQSHRFATQKLIVN